MSACHLLLRRPWQFDLDATHGGCSNNYSFVHKGVHHVLKLMSESTIKADMFATAKKKKEAFAITPKPRTALFQEGENDEPMAHQVVVSRLAQESGTVTNSFMKFGSFLVDVNASVIPYNDLFIGASSREKEKKQGKNAYKSQVGPYARLHSKMTEIK